MKKITAVFVFALLILTAAMSCYAADNIKEKGSNTYTNPVFRYTVSVPESVYVQHYPNNEDPSLLLVDAASRLTATLSCDVIDPETIGEVREYLGDYTSSDPDIFKSVVQIKNSYYSALEHTYRNDSLYGSSDQKNHISNIKIFSDRYDSIYGVNSQVVLYNTIQQGLRSVSEETYINMVIPDYSSNFIYTMSFRVEKGSMNDAAVQSIFSILKSTQIKNLKNQTEIPQILSDELLLSEANRGIYPGVDDGVDQYRYYTNEAMGYRMKYPSTFVPYKANSFINQLQYISYRITPYTVFSLQAEKTDSEGNPIQDKINALSLSEGANLQIVDAGVKILNGENAVYMTYHADNEGITKYVTRYFVKRDSMLYTLDLTSRQTPPSSKEKLEFEKICNSMEWLPLIEKAAAPDAPTSWYINEASDVRVSFPSSWKLAEDSTMDASTGIVTLKNPAMSSAVEITIQESELMDNLNYESFTKLASTDVACSKELFNHLNIPYENLRYSQLTSAFTYDSPNPKIARLVNYLDENDRQKLFYTISLIKGKKMYTLGISLSEYMLADGQQLDPALHAAINYIVDSFFVQG